MIPARFAEDWDEALRCRGIDRSQTTLYPECLEDWIDEDNPVRVIELFVEGLDLAELRFGGGLRTVRWSF